MARLRSDSRQRGIPVIFAVRHDVLGRNSMSMYIDAHHLAWPSLLYIVPRLAPRLARLKPSSSAVDDTVVKWGARGTGRGVAGVISADASIGGVTRVCGVSVMAARPKSMRIFRKYVSRNSGYQAAGARCRHRSAAAIG